MQRAQSDDKFRHASLRSNPLKLDPADRMLPTELFMHQSGAFALLEDFNNVIEVYPRTVVALDKIDHVFASQMSEARRALRGGVAFAIGVLLKKKSNSARRWCPHHAGFSFMPRCCRRRVSARGLRRSPAAGRLLPSIGRCH